MPFNGSGTFSIVNTFVPNTTILSAAVNQNFTDIATGLSDCLTRDGQAGMSAALGLISGTSSAPGLGFNADATTGLYLPASGSLGLTVKGAIGVKVSGQTYGALSAIVSAGGSNYAVGDTIYPTGGTASVGSAFTVATLSGSAVATVTMTVPGIYTVTPSNPAAQGSTSGSGTGCTLTITYNNLSSPVYNLGITDLANALLWTKLGASSFVSGIMAKANAYDYLSSLATLSTGILVNKTTSPPTITAPATPTQGSFKNLSVKVATNTTVAVAADAVVVSDGTNFISVAPSATCNLGTNGAVNSLDTGTIAVNSWYFMWVIYNGTTTGTLASLSSTSPTLPSGYTYKARVGAVQTINGSATLYGTWQYGRMAQYVVGLAQTTLIPNMANGVAGTYSITSPTLAAVAVTGNGKFVPTTASRIAVVGTPFWKNLTAGAMMFAPTTTWGGSNNGPLGSNGQVWPFHIDTGVYSSLVTWLLLETTSIAWCSNGAGSAISCLGWEDNL